MNHLNCVALQLIKDSNHILVNSSVTCCSVDAKLPLSKTMFYCECPFSSNAGIGHLTVESVIGCSSA